MNRLRISLFVVVVLSLFAIPCSAYSSGILSPGLSVISARETVIMSGLVSGEIGFSREQFERAVGREIDSLTVTALPPASDGILMCGNAPVAVNQTLKGESLDSLRFVAKNGCRESSLRFRADAEYSYECMLRYTDRVNLPPEAAKSVSAVEVWTQRDISSFGTLYGSDPDGDKMTFEIIRYPENGIVEITDREAGTYKYTPCDGVIGKDSFTYAVRDEWGNYSRETLVRVEIDRELCEVVFADMDGHWAHNAAIAMAAESSMSFASVGGKVYFSPDEPVSREDFLVTVMKHLGAEDIEDRKTVFADDGEISEGAGGYIDRAYSLGVIKGEVKDGKLCFMPKENITRAEAAVILNSILGAEVPDTVPVFSDGGSVPTWARSSIYALSNAGVFRGTGGGYISPNETLSRAEVAELLFTVTRIYN